MKEIIEADIAMEFVNPIAIACLEKSAEEKKIDETKHVGFVLSILRLIGTKMEYLMEVMAYCEIIALPSQTRIRMIMI